MTPENEILRQENETLRRRLAEAEQVNQALTSGEIDAVVDAAHQGPLLLRQAQEALRESEERYRILFDGSPLPMYLFDQETFAIAAVNEAAVLHYGYSREEFLSKTLRDIWHPDQEAGAMASLPASSGEPRSTVRQHVTKGGASITVEVFSHAVPLAGRSYRLSVIRDITERRLAEEQMERIHSEYRLLLNSIGEGVHWIGVDGRIKFENPAAAGMLGYEVSELIGKPAHLTMHHTRADGTPYPVDECVIYATLRDGVARHVKDDVFWRKNGTSFAVEYVSTPIRDEKDRPAGTVVVFTDVTERRSAEETLRSSEEQFRVMFDAASVGVAQGDPKTGRLSRVNPKLCLITGYSAEELLTLRFSDITHPDDRERDWTLFERTVTTGGSEYQIEKRYVRKDGSIVWANVNVTVLRDATGAPTRTIALIMDITERKKIEAELLLQSAALNAAVNAIVITNRDGTIVWINQAFSILTGYSAKEAIGANPRAVARSGMHDQAFYGRLWDTILAGEVWNGEITNRRKNGTLYPERLTITPVKDARGEITHFIAIKQDLTEEKRLQAQFLQVQKMEAVGRLAGGVAHDFNNLLTVIFGYSDVLLQGLEPGPLHEATEEIRRAGERAAALTRQLLAFSRKQTLVPEVLDLGGVVSGLSTMVERLIGEEIKVRVVVSPGLGRVKADRGQLEQVVMNLAVNARDAMPKGGSLIFELQNVDLDDAYTWAHDDVEPGPYVLLAISDTGTGMDTETQKRIFEPFFTTKEAGKGTGLGLSTVHGIVLQSGGAISVYSEPGRGTTFKVYLPRFAGDAAARRSLSGIHPKLPTGSETVLVVEDEAAIRQLTNLILQRAGYIVLLAESPVAAERIAGSHSGPIHVMLTDVVMPGMRGPELAERLLRERPDLRVLYMSGYTDDAIAHHGFLDAGTAFLQKPFTPLGLMKKIREVLEA